MEIVTTPFQVIFEKIVDYTIGVVARQMGYLICYRSNVDNLKTQVNELKDARQSVEDKVKAATNNVEEIEANVLKWLTCVEEITTEVHKFFEEEGQAKLKCCHDWCPNLKARYQLSKRAYKMGLDVKKIQDKGIFPTIGHRVPIQGVTPISTKGFEDFESRKTILEGIMKALKDDNIHAIGLYPKSPNLKQIQKDIAKELDLKFEDEDTNFQKAHLLRERLKIEKILVIVDDIWKKLDLKDLGIYFGDNQKGSKLLLTSRFRNVLEIYVDVQQLFYVEILSKNEAEYLFAKIVGDLPETLNLQPTLVEVVKECAGLPIAITAVANALKNQKNLKVWKDALRQLKRANPTQIDGMHEMVYQSIKLSYNFLTKEEQSLFLFCSSFEEDMNIEIAFLWRILVGLEFFQDVYTVEDVRNRVHTLVESLKASGLLLDGNGSGTFKMHDIIRDVAIYIADKDKEMLTIRTSDELEKWSNMKILKDFIGISLFDVKFSELPKKLEDAQLNFIFLYDKDNSSPIPNHFFEQPGKGIRSILYEVDQEGFPQLKHLYVRNSVEIQYIINSIGGQQVAFPILESISLINMSNLEKICHDQLAMGSFRNLKKLEDCKVMNEIVAKERENEIDVNDNNNVMADIIEFTQLRSLVNFEARLEDGTLIAKSEGVEFTVKEGYFCPALSKAVKTMK
uniref:NB-ARC domain-containing protein n=1 Tax=Fagus sylvatica TaxID=28930 RepID=A0A2N9I8X1_FAGSY